MTAGRLKYLQFGEKGPKSPAFQVVFEGGSRLVLTEAGAKKRAGVWLLTPEEAKHELAVVRREEQALRASLGPGEPFPLKCREGRVERLQRRDVRRPGLDDRERRHGIVQPAAPGLHLR